MKFLIGYFCGIVSVGINYLIFMSENNCHIKVLYCSFVILCMAIIAALTNLFIKDKEKEGGKK